MGQVPDRKPSPIRRGQPIRAAWLNATSVQHPLQSIGDKGLRIKATIEAFIEMDGDLRKYDAVFPDGRTFPVYSLPTDQRFVGEVVFVVRYQGKWVCASPSATTPVINASNVCTVAYGDIPSVEAVFGGHPFPPYYLIHGLLVNQWITGITNWPAHLILTHNSSTPTNAWLAGPFNRVDEGYGCEDEVWVTLEEKSYGLRLEVSLLGIATTCAKDIKWVWVSAYPQTPSSFYTEDMRLSLTQTPVGAGYELPPWTCTVRASPSLVPYANVCGRMDTLAPLKINLPYSLGSGTLVGELQIAGDTGYSRWTNPVAGCVYAPFTACGKEVGYATLSSETGDYVLKILVGLNSYSATLSFAEYQAALVADSMDLTRDEGDGTLTCADGSTTLTVEESAPGTLTVTFS